jgi:hypothetical protein
MKPEITLIKKGGPNPVMSKRIFLDEQEKVCSDGSQCLMAQGTATRATAETAADLAEHIIACGTDQAIALGALRADLPNSANITIPAKLKDNPGAITRSRDFIDYRSGAPAWALIDFDTKGMPASVAASIEAVGGTWNALLNVAPGLQRAARVSRASTSSGLYRPDTGMQFSGSGGTHHYILVKDASDIERFLRDLHDRCWQHGLGWHLIGRAGQLLDRSLVDRMVAYGERLCFEGAPVVEPPLAQDVTERIPDVFEGEPIDTELVIPRLTEYQRHLIDEVKAESAEALGKAAAEIRAQHDQTLAERISAKSGMPIDSASRFVAARHRGVLLPHLDLDFDHLGIVSVAEVIADPDRFVGETLADPLEGADYGRCKAKVMRGDDGRLLIHSYAHGRAIYLVRHDARSAKAAIAKAPVDGLVDYAMAILAMTEMEADELTDFANTVAKKADVGVQAVKARIAKDRREREQAKRKATLVSGGDGRWTRPRPQPDGELLPTTKFLDEVLGSDQREEPPMRDASGNFVEVRVTKQWALHLLTADGTNAAVGDAETLKAPAEPTLVRLTPTGVEMLVERYVAFRVEKKNAVYFGALPGPFVTALMQFSPSVIPVVRAINTAPLVAMSGQVIDGAGLDRDSGLVHRIDPPLRACVPTNPPTEQDVRDALIFLLDAWLVDVALDRVGKCIAIMLALTLIERALLPERPAFFVTAGQRGGGKTTLVNMITLAALGRRAAAAAWSENGEERKKALFSYLRQSLACLVWDNIPRGAAISCPHIEAALTASEISDRVLGVSQVETVPSTTVQIFTGNSIAPRGDMASRSLMLALNVDRPDPENREFKHADPLGWTQANRAKIVHALYTLLIAGALNRPKQQEAKTRFKTWWNLVGWSMEYAASLTGTTVDCTDLLRAGEVEDEEALAVSAVLTILRQIWGDRTFTAMDVVQAMTPGTHLDDRDIAKAEALADALAELAGKQLERPSSRSIGKFLGNRLVGRPAWIGDSRTVATLRKTDRHNANTYRIHITASGEEQKRSPHSPHSPPQDPGDGEMGNVGNGGKDIPLNEVGSSNSKRAKAVWSGRL